jgi:hypothetical protein
LERLHRGTGTLRYLLSRPLRVLGSFRIAAENERFAASTFSFDAPTISVMKRHGSNIAGRRTDVEMTEYVAPLGHFALQR